MEYFENYYKKIMIAGTHTPSCEKIRKLLDEIWKRLPDEEQFELAGNIHIQTSDQRVKFWKYIDSKFGFDPSMDFFIKDGNFKFWITENLEDSPFVIILIEDKLNKKSDNYIKGLIAYKFSEMSYEGKILIENWDKLKKLKLEERKIMFDQITKRNAPVGRNENQEYEKNVNEEGNRLGFSKELHAYDLGQ